MRKNNDFKSNLFSFLKKSILTLEKVVKPDELNLKISGYDYLKTLFDEHLSKFSEIDKIYNFLQTNSHFSKHLNAPFCVPEISREWRFTESEFLRMAIQAFYFNGANKTIFNRIFSDVNDFFGKDYVECVSYAPLYGLIIEEAKKVVLKSNLEISRLDDFQYTGAATLGVIRRNLTNFGGNFFGLKYFYTIPKVFGKSLSDLPSPPQETAKAEEIIHRSVTALQLFKDQVIGFPGVIHVLKNQLMQSGSWFGTNRAITNAIYIYQLSNRKEINQLKDFYYEFESVNFDKFKWLDIAIRRYCFSKERDYLDDKFLDLLISAEALFLSDASSKADQGELNYRLSQRAALLNGDKVEERIAVLKIMKEAYSIRSAIAHGGTPKRDKKPYKIEELWEIFGTIEKLMRHSIKTMIRLAAIPNTSKFLVDWNNLIFSTKPQKIRQK